MNVIIHNLTNSIRKRAYSHAGNNLSANAVQCSTCSYAVWPILPNRVKSVHSFIHFSKHFPEGFLANKSQTSSNVFWVLADAYQTPSNVYQTLSNMFWVLTDSYQTPSNVFWVLANVYQMLANVFWVLTDVYRTSSNVFWVPANVYQMLANVYQASANVYYILPFSTLANYFITNGITNFSHALQGNYSFAISLNCPGILKKTKK